MLRRASLIWKRAPFGVALLLPIAACSTSTGMGSQDRCDTLVVFTPETVLDAHPEQPCEIVVTNGARTLRVEVPGITACDTVECDASCSSPDLQMGFAVCNRGGKLGGSIFVETDGQSAVAIGPFLGVTPRNPMASVTITCGGQSVWSGQVSTCGVAM